MSAGERVRRIWQPPPGIIPRFYRMAIVGYLVAMLVHFAFIPVFALLDIWPMAVLNIFSVSLWGFALYHLRHGRPVFSWLIGTAELTIHAVFAVYYLGADLGFQFFLLVLAVISYALPIRRVKVIPITVIQTLTFVLLVLYDRNHVPVYTLPENLVRLFYLMNVATTVLGISFPLAVFMTSLERTEKALALAYQQSEDLLHNILPTSIAGRLKQKQGIIADSLPDVSILFADIVDFSRLAEKMSPERLIEMLNGLFEAFDELAERHGVEKIKTVGDAYMAAAGVPEARPDHAKALARFALDAREAVARYNRTHGTDLHIRIGIHSGPVTAGVIGKLRFLYDLWGDTVNTASRMESHGRPDTIQVSEATYTMLRDQFEFEDRGWIDVKGKGTMHTWLLIREHAA